MPLVFKSSRTHRTKTSDCKSQRLFSIMLLIVYCMLLESHQRHTRGGGAQQRCQDGCPAPHGKTIGKVDPGRLATKQNAVAEMRKADWIKKRTQQSLHMRQLSRSSHHCSMMGGAPDATKPCRIFQAKLM